MKTIGRLPAILFVIFLTLSCSSDPIEQIGDIERIIDDSTKSGGERDSSESSTPGESGGNYYNPFDGYEKHVIEAYKRA